MFEVLCSIVALFITIVITLIAMLIVVVSAIVGLFARAIPLIIAGVALAAIYHFFINPLW